MTDRLWLATTSHRRFRLENLRPQFCNSPVWSRVASSNLALHVAKALESKLHYWVLQENLVGS